MEESQDAESNKNVGNCEKYRNGKENNNDQNVN